MKSPKSNTKFPVATKNLSLRHPRCDLSATLRSSSEQPVDFTVHYTGHRESTYVTVNVTHFSHGSLKTLTTGNSHKILAFVQIIDVDPHPKSAKSRRVETFW
jgi:hypothetical protein